mmetsp:Transcript_2094/g.4735  ORF Transcript_2094/g.4735 Transcript_2094/m.4735 type:complete len:254 (+) Transcript_2094:599-1360(+)
MLLAAVSLRWRLGDLCAGACGLHIEGRHDRREYTTDKAFLAQEGVGQRNSQRGLPRRQVLEVCSGCLPGVARQLRPPQTHGRNVPKVLCARVSLGCSIRAHCVHQSLDDPLSGMDQQLLSAPLLRLRLDIGWLLDQFVLCVCDVAGHHRAPHRGGDCRPDARRAAVAPTVPGIQRHCRTAGQRGHIRRAYVCASVRGQTRHWRHIRASFSDILSRQRPPQLTTNVVHYWLYCACDALGAVSPPGHTLQVRRSP